MRNNKDTEIIEKSTLHTVKQSRYNRLFDQENPSKEPLVYGINCVNSLLIFNYVLGAYGINRSI